MSYEQLLTEEIQLFIQQNENLDPHELVLKSAKHSELPLKLIATQIQSRKKAKQKLPSWHTTPGIVFPEERRLEQASSELTAKFKASLVSGRSLADLTGGTGVDTHQFALHFDQVIYNEPDPDLCRLAAHNFQQLGVDNIMISSQSAEDFLSGDPSFDWYYLDPSRRLDGDRVFRIRDCQPDLNVVMNRVPSGAKLLLKLSPMLDVQELLRDIKGVSTVIALSVKNDCKELLAVVDGTSQTIKLNAINITSNETDQFEFLLGDEDEADVSYAAPQQYLYEPNASVMKLGAFKLVALRNEVHKLHINSHLYTSEEKKSEFPGRVFTINQVFSFSWKQLASLRLRKANIAVRNFPHTVQQIRKRSGIREGGEQYVFFTTGIDEVLYGLVCEKV